MELIDCINSFYSIAEFYSIGGGRNIVERPLEKQLPQKTVLVYNTNISFQEAINLYMPKIKSPLTIVHVSSECAPYAKSGGLGDVVQQLPNALAKKGANVCTIIPFYGFLKNRVEVESDTVLPRTTIVLRGKKYKTSLRKIKDKDKTNNPIFLVENEELFGSIGQLYTPEQDGLRFLFFDLAVVTFLESMVKSKIAPFKNGRIDILHCHDWHSGIIPELLKDHNKFPHLKSTAAVYTIHNLAFQGQTDWWKIHPNKKDTTFSNPLKKTVPTRYLNFTKRAIMNASLINTVSERYALEIMTKEFGQGLNKTLSNRKEWVYGIINGVDYSVWNPKFDRSVFVNFDDKTFNKKKINKEHLQKLLGLAIKPNTPVIGMSNRLAEQKGIGLIMAIMEELLKLDVQLAIVGSGDKQYLSYFKKIARKYPKQVAISTPYSEPMASKVYAGSDMYLMPSHFEPCGISQLISLRYGAVPIVHSTGGLHDTITDVGAKVTKGNGFVFKDFTGDDLLVAIVRACDAYQHKGLWKKLALRGMKQSFSWDLPAKKYLELYNIALQLKARNGNGNGLKNGHKKYVLG